MAGILVQCIGYENSCKAQVKNNNTKHRIHAQVKNKFVRSGFIVVKTLHYFPRNK